MGNGASIPLLLKDSRIAALWCGLAFNGFGGQLSGIALVWLAIEIAGPNASYVSTAQLAMSLVASSGASAFVDRFAPRTMMIAADLVPSMVLIVTVVVISIFGLSLWGLIATSMALAALGAVFQPTLLSSVPLIAVTKERIQGTNALLDATARLSRLLGPFLAGPLSTLIPLLHFLTINAATFVISAAGIAAVGKAIAAPVPQQSSSSVWEKITRGYHVAPGDQRIAKTLAANTAVLSAWFIAVGLGFPFLAAGAETDDLWFTGIGALAALAGAYGAGDFYLKCMGRGGTSKKTRTLHVQGIYHTRGRLSFGVCLPMAASISSRIAHDDASVLLRRNRRAHVFHSHDDLPADRPSSDRVGRSLTLSFRLKRNGHDGGFCYCAHAVWRDWACGNNLASR